MGKNTGGAVMLLAIDIGNSSISTGLFCLESGELKYTFKLSSDRERTADEYFAQFGSMLYMSDINKNDIKGAVISSVVPTLTHKLEDCAHRLCGQKPKTVGPGLKTGFAIKIDNPSELGSDLVANTAGVLGLGGKGRAYIIVDMGTATTISAVSESGEYLGNCIMPGVRVSLDSLHTETAQLPEVTLSTPKRAIGKNSGDSVRSGVVFGNSIMIDGLIDEFEKEMKLKGGAAVYATGGLCEGVIPACRHEMVYQPHLTLYGLYFIYKNNA